MITGIEVFDGAALIGVALLVLFLALVEKLRRTFATGEEVAELTEKLRVAQAVAEHARDIGEEAGRRAAAVEREQRVQWERVVEQGLRPLERVSDKVEGMAQSQAAHEAALSHLLQRLDRIEPVPLAARRRRSQ